MQLNTLTSFNMEDVEDVPQGKQHTQKLKEQLH